MHNLYPHLAALLLSIPYAINNRWGPFSAGALCMGIDLMIQYVGNPT